MVVVELEVVGFVLVVAAEAVVEALLWREEKSQK